MQHRLKTQAETLIFQETPGKKNAYILFKHTTSAVLQFPTTPGHDTTKSSLLCAPEGNLWDTCKEFLPQGCLLNSCNNFYTIFQMQEALREAWSEEDFCQKSEITLEHRANWTWAVPCTLQLHSRRLLGSTPFPSNPFSVQELQATLESFPLVIFPYIKTFPNWALF